MAIDALLGGPVRVINIGLESFARDLAANGAPVAQVDWSPPRFAFDEKIEQANAEALRRILAAEPVLADVRRAGELIPRARRRAPAAARRPADRMAAHVRPAARRGVRRDRVRGLGGRPRRGREARRLGRRCKFAPNHHFGAVGPMTGITTRSMPLLVVENRKFGNRAACTINEGLGKVMRFGGNDAEVLARLAWLRDEFGPLLGTRFALR